jgi:hypothetical protein
MTFFNVSLPTPLTILAYIATPVVLALGAKEYKTFNRKRSAARMGADLLPHVQMGGFAVVRAIGESFKNGYVGV